MGLQLDLVNDALEGIGTVLKLNDLGIVEGKQDLALSALITDDVQKAEANVVNAVFAMQHGGNGDGGIHAAEQALAQVADGDGDGIEGSALAADDTGTRLLDVFLYLVIFQLGEESIRILHGLGILGNRNVGNVDKRPRHKAGVTMLTQHVGVYVLLVDGVVLGEAGAQTGGIENGTRSDDLVFGQIRAFMEHIRQNINGVADDDVNSIGSIACDLGDDVLHDVYVCLSQIQARLSCLSGQTRGDNNDIGACGVLIAACVDAGRVTEGRSLADVKSLALGLFTVDVDHNDLGGKSCDSEGICDRRANATRSNDGDFVHGVLLN